MLPRSHRWYLALVAVGLAIAIAMALVAAHLRLVNSGLGCTDWPQCYGRIGPSASGEVQPERETGAAQLTHRVLASTLGTIVLLVFAANARYRRARISSGLLLLITLGLAALGRYSAGLERPAVVIANYGGGIMLAALFWWLLVSAMRQATGINPALQGWSALTITALSAQLLSGGLVSAFFAGLACGASIGCDGNWSSTIPWHAVFTQFGQLTLDDTGKVIIGESLSGLHMAHRLGGVAVAAVLLWQAWLLHQSGRTGLAGTTLALTMAAVMSGVLAVSANLARELVLAHYVLALTLLLLTISAGTSSHLSQRSRHRIGNTC